MQVDPTYMHSAEAVLRHNDLGSYTSPQVSLYPHQWLWDSCFIAIGLRHIDIDRAKLELRSLLEGQWHNGMLPNIIFSNHPRYAHDRAVWNSKVNQASPDSVHTSGITQPPLLAEAVYRVGKSLPRTERIAWYSEMLPAIIKYHSWLYTERDPHNEGLTIQLHPWETGMDNTPAWMSEMHGHQLNSWIRAIDSLKLAPLLTHFRRDTRSLPASHRIDTIDALGLYATQQRLKRKNYDASESLKHALFAIEDVAFNAILIRANQLLIKMARVASVELPDELIHKANQTETAFRNLWDPYSNQYFSRDFITKRLIKEPSIATFIALYSGIVPKENVAHLLRQLENEHSYGTAYPVPSVPLNSPMFNPVKYWQGPVWVNMNWMIIDGLKRSGNKDYATALTMATTDMIEGAGFSEYFNPEDGSAAGIDNFSWTAALYIDLLKG